MSDSDVLVSLQKLITDNVGPAVRLRARYNELSKEAYLKKRRILSDRRGVIALRPLDRWAEARVAMAVVAAKAATVTLVVVEVARVVVGAVAEVAITWHQRMRLLASSSLLLAAHTVPREIAVWAS